MKGKILLTMLLTSVLYGCTYFEVKDAIKEANKGNYVRSIENLSGILREHNDDRRTLDAFEIIFPDAEKRYYDEIDANKAYNMRAYTKAMLNLLKIQDIYFNLPETSKKSMAIIEPPLAERNELKKQIALNFYSLGENMPTDSYLSKLKAYGYFETAQKYNVLGDKKITNKYLNAKDKASGKFIITMNSSIGNEYIPSQIKFFAQQDIQKYPIFSIGNDNSYNLNLKIAISNMYYYPPTTDVKTGTDSYTETRERTVMKKVTDTKIVNGKEVEVVRWVPTTVYEDYDVYYRFEKYTKTTTLGYQLTYTIEEKNGNIISTNTKNIVAKDEVKWTKYFPYRPYASIDSFKFPRSEAEKNTISENELIDMSIKLSNSEINKMIDSLYSNTEPQL
ncbi:hypothetical protein IX317_000519 [Fusobacterium sp. DD29]|uniref:hypothetical protein n=1 Tax=unclassified Fusobacterium TaxID=2648384 RepID=UPI001B8ABD47|nr:MULTISPECIES: hypothetical protein [unclassified Fusobacterium]MBR8701849.1 hypothetical protein [Fusobacterium sp. DD45]MBR8711630.1 hypothetical protein [Fusobacterium sp. DD28]MBR8748858.1 hypothetical protein [Fusobacterium sp. DD29]MBR8752179.1 hypothetical protein [Fusobacterium sp. DD26]MBR8761125.1 hypothetical protein [Fusobacterium sp. DD25]